MLCPCIRLWDEASCPVFPLPLMPCWGTLNVHCLPCITGLCAIPLTHTLMPLSLFMTQDPELQSQWQHNLMGTSSTFKRPKLELADGLILMANCMYEIGRRQSSVEHLYLSLEAIHLSAALMHNSMDLVQEVLSHLELLSQHVALALTQALTRIKSSKLMELMVVYGAQCTSCVERRDFVEALLVRLSLPVRYEAGSGGSSAAQLEVTHPTFVHDAYVRQLGEEQEQFSRRLMQQLVGMVRLGLLSDLNVPCSKWSDEQDCEVHMPGWMHSANKTVSGSGTGAQGAASGSNVSSPATPASSAGSRGAATVAPPEPMLPPDPGALIEALYSGNVQQDLRRLQWTLELLAGQYAAAAAAQAAAHAPTPQGATAWAALATSWGDEQEGQVRGQGGAWVGVGVGQVCRTQQLVDPCATGIKVHVIGNVLCLW